MRRKRKTEQDWFSIGHPLSLLRYHKGEISDRKLRMIALACYRMVWNDLESNDSRFLVEFAERLADRTLPQQEVEEMRRYAHILAEENPSIDLCFWLKGLLEPSMRPVPISTWNYWYMCKNITESILLSVLGVNEQSEEVLKGPLCGVIHDILGNPFRPVTFDPTWRIPTTQALARSMYDTRDFTAMPILGDALEEAGCDTGDILSHCRDKTGHVRGCWVVDLLLGKR